MALANARELGKKGGYKYIEVPCIDCGTLHWVALKHKKPRSQRCHSCSSKKKMLDVDTSMEKNPNWRGGRRKAKDGYGIRTIHEGHPYHSMTTNGSQVREHRLVIAEYLGRALDTNEIVHHINGVKWDNRIENLELVNKPQHSRTHHETIKFLQERIAQLEDIVKELKQVLTQFEEVK